MAASVIDSGGLFELLVVSIVVAVLGAAMMMVLRQQVPLMHVTARVSRNELPI